MALTELIEINHDYHEHAKDQTLTPGKEDDT